jgi:hypothetical protein
MARVLIIAYTRFAHDGRVKRHAEALAARGDSVDAITLRNGHDGMRNGVNVIGLPVERYRGSKRALYLASYLRFFAGAARLAFKLGRSNPYDVVIACTLPDTAVLSALPVVGSLFRMPADTGSETHLARCGWCEDADVAGADLRGLCRSGLRRTSASSIAPGEVRYPRAQDHSGDEFTATGDF